MKQAPLVVGGWSIYAHPLFLDQFETLVRRVKSEKRKDPTGFRKKKVAKLLAAVIKVAFEDIPSDPTRAIYRQGDTLGPGRQHWFRAKFLQQYRLFFRYRQTANAKIIVLAWVNDDATLRAYGSTTDAYAVFRNLLNGGDPPENWDSLMAAAEAAAPRLRMTKPT